MAEWPEKKVAKTKTIARLDCRCFAVYTHLMSIGNLSRMAFRGVLERKSYGSYHQAYAFEILDECLVCSSFPPTKDLQVSLWRAPLASITNCVLQADDARCISLTFNQEHVVVLRASDPHTTSLWLNKLTTATTASTIAASTATTASTIAASTTPTIPTPTAPQSTVPNDPTERAVLIQQKLMAPFTTLKQSDVSSNMDACANILSWLVGTMDAAYFTQQPSLLTEHLRICHPYLVMQMTSFASSTSNPLSLNDCFRVMDSLTSYDTYLRCCCTLFPIEVPKYSFSIHDEQQFLCKCCVQSLRPQLLQMCQTVKKNVLDDVDLLSHVKKRNDGVVTTHVVQDLTGIANDYSQLADQGSNDFLLARVLQCIAEDLLAAYTVHIQDFLQFNAQSEQDPHVLLAMSNDSMKLASLIESMADENDTVMESHPKIEEAMQKSEQHCLRVANIAIESLSDFLMNDLMALSVVLFDEETWSNGEHLGSLVLTGLDYIEEFSPALDRFLHRSVVRSFLETTCVFYCRTLLSEGFKLHEKSRLTIGHHNAHLLHRDLRRLKCQTQDVCKDILNTEKIPASIAIIGQVYQWFETLLTATNGTIRSTIETVFEEMVRQLATSQTKHQLFNLSHAYCFISQTMLVRACLKTEVLEQDKGLEWCRQQLEPYGLTADTLKEAENRDYKTKGYASKLEGLGGILQRICPLTTDQFDRDVRGHKKRSITKLKKKYLGFRPRVTFSSSLLFFNKHAVVSKQAKTVRVRHQSGEGGKTTTASTMGGTEDPFRLVETAKDEEEKRERSSSLGLGDFEQDLLGGLACEKPRTSSLDMDTLAADLLGDLPPLDETVQTVVQKEQQPSMHVSMSDTTLSAPTKTPQRPPRKTAPQPNAEANNNPPSKTAPCPPTNTAQKPPRTEAANNPPSKTAPCPPTNIAQKPPKTEAANNPPTKTAPCPPTNIAQRPPRSKAVNNPPTKTAPRPPLFTK